MSSLSLQTLESLLIALKSREPNDEAYREWCQKKNVEGRQYRLRRAHLEMARKQFEQLNGAESEYENEHSRPLDGKSRPTTGKIPTFEEWLARKLMRRRRLHAQLREEERRRRAEMEKAKLESDAAVAYRVREWNDRHARRRSEIVRQEGEKEQKEAQEKEAKKAEAQASYDNWSRRRLKQLNDEVRRKNQKEIEAAKNRAAVADQKRMESQASYVRWMTEKQLRENEERKMLEELYSEAQEVAIEERAKRWNRGPIVLSYSVRHSQRVEPHSVGTSTSTLQSGLCLRGPMGRDTISNVVPVGRKKPRAGDVGSDTEVEKGYQNSTMGEYHLYGSKTPVPANRLIRGLNRPKVLRTTSTQSTTHSQSMSTATEARAVNHAETMQEAIIFRHSVLR